MALQEQGYGGATARDCAAEMFAEELADALRAQAIRVEVRETTVLAVLHDGGAFSVSVAARAGDQ